MPTEIPCAEATRTYQSRLPRLPIPSLQQSTKLYLQSLKPLLTPEQWQQTAVYVQDFVKPGGEGERLQQRLQAYDRTQSANWLEKWWLQCAYLQWRDPLLINSNYFMLAKDDPHQPPFTDGPENPKAGFPPSKFTPFQIRRAAHMIFECLNIVDALETDAKPPERTHQGPLCMDQYYRIFGTYRIPRPGCDELVQTHALSTRHIIVLARDQAFKLCPFADTAERIRLSAGDIETQLWHIVQDVETNPLDPSICVLTTDHRDTWAENYEYIHKLDAVNADSLATIETALFGLSLDDYSTGADIEASARGVFTGRQGHNRWMDKPLMLTVEASGRAGVNGEHSPCDALIPALIFEYLVEIPTRWPATLARNMYRYEKPQRLHFRADDRVTRMVAAAEARAQKAIAQSNLRVLHFTAYGTDYIKRVCRIGPDAYVQMALQLAYFRVHRKVVATYETSSTRKYLHGRTDTIRALTEESVAFTRAMDDPKVDRVKVYQLLRQAALRHAHNSRQAADGQAIDRHLLGLKLIHLLLDQRPASELHPIFTDPAFALSSTWILSTSSIHEGTNYTATGFGCIVHEGGYGVNYMKDRHLIKFGIEAKRDGGADASEFHKQLEKALTDMGQLCKEQAAKISSARL
ncbi:hypothetical protein H4R35_000044 [Dimargaris xerosporica]|nr:hypothetical protein H4R35_000044 [Dimargaris xerosporica]